MKNFYAYMGTKDKQLKVEKTDGPTETKKPAEPKGDPPVGDV